MSANLGERTTTYVMGIVLGLGFFLFSLLWGFFCVYLAPTPRLDGTREASAAYDQHFKAMFALVIAEQLVGWIAGVVLVLRSNHRDKVFGISLLVGAAITTALCATWMYIASTILAGF